MPSPDLSAYTDLVLYDVDPQDLAANALEQIPTYLQGYNPQEGDPDLELLGTLATVCAPVIYAVNRVPNGVVDVLAQYFNVTRYQGAPATTTVQFTVAASALGVEIPAGTVILIDLGNGTIVTFTTNTAVVSAANATTVTAAATAVENGADANNVPSGTVVAVRSPIIDIDSARLATATVGGQDPESDAAWRSRFASRTGRLTSTLVLPAHFTAAALDTPTVWRATTIDLWDGTTATPGTVPGHVTVAVRGAASATIPTATKTAMQATMQAAALALLTVHVVDATVTNVNVTVTYHLTAGADQAAATAAVTTAIQNYLSPDTWMWGGTVRANELIALIDPVPGVDYVAAATVQGAATYTLPGAAPLANLGTLTITVA